LHMTAVVDPGVGSGISAIALYAWPVAVTGLVLLLRWNRLSSRRAMAVLGYLTSVGVGALFRQFGFTVFWIHIAPQTAGDQVLSDLVNVSLSIAVFGTIISVAPVLWLSRILAVDSRRHT
jgi:hypothetical protein